MHYGLKLKNADDVKKKIASNRWQNTVLDFREDFRSKLTIRACKGLGQEGCEWNH